jgi:SPP1 gp7 family putative phage head morphogenesis protein
MVAKVAGPVSRQERRQARLQNKDKAVVERLGVAEARRVGFRVQLATLRAFRRGQDPIAAMQRELQTLVEPLMQTMVTAHLQGRRRSLIGVEQHKTLSLGIGKTAMQGAQAYLKARMLLSPAELTNLGNVHKLAATQLVGSTAGLIKGKLEQSLLTIVGKGMHTRQGVAELRGAFKAAGIVPDNSYTLENVFRTQTQVAYSAGRFNADQDPAVQEILWGYKYVTVGDDRVRPEHAGYEGVTLPKSDGFWDANMPPNGYSCRCSAISVYKPRKTARPKAVDVNGKMVTPSTDRGFQFNPGKVTRDPLSQLSEKGKQARSEKAKAGAVKRAKSKAAKAKEEKWTNT